MISDKYIKEGKIIQDKFMEIIEKMDMSFSYKPVLIKAMFEHVADIIDSFIDYYSDRKNKGLVSKIQNNNYCRIKYQGVILCIVLFCFL